MLQNLNGDKSASVRSYCTMQVSVKFSVRFKSYKITFWFHCLQAAIKDTGYDKEVISNLEKIKSIVNYMKVAQSDALLFNLCGLIRSFF